MTEDIITGPTFGDWLENLLGTETWNMVKAADTPPQHIPTFGDFADKPWKDCVGTIKKKCSKIGTKVETKQ